MKSWMQGYIEKLKSLHDAIPPEEFERIVAVFKQAHDKDRMIFTFGNGANAAHASHFATDMGKGASDTLDKPFRILSLNDNTSWLTAVGNDYSYEDVFVRQLKNYGKPGDVVFTMSVSGNSPNCVAAVRWAKENGLKVLTVVGEKRGVLADLADVAIVLPDNHYGRVEDAQIAICHMIASAFMEGVA
jgi:D-sedoheptulose 7-phosphate isomerase